MKSWVQKCILRLRALWMFSPTRASNSRNVVNKATLKLGHGSSWSASLIVSTGIFFSFLDLTTTTSTPLSTSAAPFSEPILTSLLFVSDTLSTFLFQVILGGSEELFADFARALYLHAARSSLHFTQTSESLFMQVSSQRGHFNIYLVSGRLCVCLTS